LSGRGDSLVGDGDDFVGVHAGPARAAGSADWPRIWRRVVQGTPSYRVFLPLDSDLGFPWDLVPTFGSALLIGAFLAQYRLGIRR
jgi:hypothetical protein